MLRGDKDLVRFRLSVLTCLITRFSQYEELEGEVSHQGPVVQSIVSSTSLLRGQLVKCFTTL